MAISRAQIPEQVDVFQDGGESSTDRYNTLVKQLSGADYDTSYQKYYDRLSQISPPREKMSIYDVASELGAGLLSTPNTGVGSTYTGLGVGFTRISDRLQAAKEEDRKMRQTVGLKAAQMAMESEEKALQFLRDYEMEQLKYRNKRGDLLTLVKDLPDGKVDTRSVRDNYANDTIINDLLKQGYYVRGSGSNISVNTGAKYSKRDEKAITEQYKAEEEILEKYRAGISSVANLEEAEAIANRLGQQNFGTISKFTLFPRQLLEGFGITDANRQDVLGDQILLSQISLGFTMDIVSRTKGAISNREMEMFERASPGLGSNYNGFLKQVEYLKRIAQRDVDFFNAYTAEASRLEGLELDGQISASQVRRDLAKFEGDWYDENLLFSDEEYDELEKIAKGDYTDAAGNVYTTPEDFDTNQWRKSYREGQAKGDDMKSSYSMNDKKPVIEAFERKIVEIQNDPNLDENQKADLIAKIEQKIKEQTQ
tara:strand:- start:403 stop:1848 length:1446 start_codon:yes stop_codon:yes gene_type:complete